MFVRNIFHPMHSKVGKLSLIIKKVRSSTSHLKTRDGGTSGDMTSDSLHILFRPSYLITTLTYVLMDIFDPCLILNLKKKCNSLTS
jgi:hypothetical protein